MVLCLLFSIYYTTSIALCSFWAVPLPIGERLGEGLRRLYGVAKQIKWRYFYLFARLLHNNQQTFTNFVTLFFPITSIAIWEYIILLLKGVFVGILSSAPLGPAGVICIQRTLNRGRLHGFVSGVGVAIADTIFAAISVFSLMLVQTSLTESANEVDSRGQKLQETSDKVLAFVGHYESFLLLGVGIVVVLVGFKIMMTNPVKQIRAKGKNQGTALGAFVSNFFLTINPINILPVLFFTTLLGVNATTVPHALAAILGVLLGALLWWFVTTGLISRYRKHFKLRQMWWLNRISGGIILFLGALAGLRGVYHWVAVLFFS